MKKRKKWMLLLFCSLLVTGCGDKNGASGKTYDSKTTVDEVVESQMSQNTEPTQTDMEKDPVADVMENQETENDEPADAAVDYDLTQMGSDMVYAMVYQMMVAPEQYEGQTFRIEGNFYASYYEETGQYYYYCVIQDAVGCCSQGMEFVWGDGSHVYPDEYPQENADIIVEGTFETYTDRGDKNLYCRLSHATIQLGKKDSQ